MSELTTLSPAPTAIYGDQSLTLVRAATSWRLHGTFAGGRVRAEVDAHSELAFLEIDREGLSVHWRPNRGEWMATVERPDRRTDTLLSNPGHILIETPTPFFDALLIRRLNLVPGQSVQIDAIMLTADFEARRRKIDVACLETVDYATPAGTFEAFRYSIDGVDVWIDATGLPLRRAGRYEIASLASEPE